MMQGLRSFILVALFCISLMAGQSNLAFCQSVDNRQAQSGLAANTVSSESNDIKSARDAEELCSQKAMEMESYFHQNQDKLIAEFIESFRQVCLKLKALQLKKEKGKIDWIVYWMLPTKPLDRNAFYLIEAFDKKGLENFSSQQFKYSVGWSFRFLEQIEVELEKNLKLPAAKNKRTEAKKYSLGEVNRYHEYVVRLARYAMERAAKLPEFQALQKEEQFQIRVGEYLAGSVVVYAEDRGIKANTAKARLAGKVDWACINKAFSGKDLSGGYYWGIILEYADLRGTNLSRSDLGASCFTGAKLNGGSLAESSLSRAWIFEADFSNCDLRKACFANADGTAGIVDMSWKKPGFRPVNFRGANLEGANFENAKLRGAVFIGANVKNANFTGADLEKAVFSKSDSVNLNLSEAQRRQVVWEELQSGPNHLSSTKEAKVDEFAISKLIDNYEKSIVNAINTNDFSLVEKYLTPGSNLYNSQKSLVAKLNEKKTQEKLTGYKVEKVTATEQANNYQVYVAEKIGIKKADKADFIVSEFRWVYTANFDGTKYTLGDIAKWDGK